MPDPELRLAANQIGFDLGPIDNLPFGHFQVVFVGNDGTQEEIEVQAGNKWKYSIFGQDHTVNTPNYGDSDRYSSYKFTRDDLGGRDPEDIWEILEKTHGEFLEKGSNIDYTPNQNSNSYATTILNVVGINIDDYADKLMVYKVDEDGKRQLVSFPGQGLNVLEKADTAIALNLKGTDGNDIIRTGLGNDKLSGENGNDYLYGGGGNDVLSGGYGFDGLDGGEGEDTADYSFYISSDGLKVDLDKGEASFRREDAPGGEIEHLISIEHVKGGGGKDTLIGSAAKNEMYGGNGDDLLYGRGGSDTLQGGAGNDFLYGEDGSDFLDGGAGSDNLDGGAGSDVLDGNAGLDTINGGVGNDIYVYPEVGDSPGNFNQSDGINFEFPGAKLGDRIDFSLIDADATKAYGQSFTFLGTEVPAAGQGAAKVWVADSFQDNYGSITLVNASIDADKDPELLIRVGDGTATAADWTVDDFILS